MFNLQFILGHLGGDPEMRFTPQGTPITTFSVAANHCFNKSDGQKTRETEWFTVQTWSKLAEVCKQWLAKGALVLVLGRTKTQVWTGDDGQKHTKKIVVADRVIFVDLKNDEAEQTDLGAAEPVEVDAALVEENIPY
jgi:single-strand DNA-binding protein